MLEIQNIVNLEKERRKLLQSRIKWKIISLLKACAIFIPLICLMIYKVRGEKISFELLSEILFDLIMLYFAYRFFYEKTYKVKTREFALQYKALYIAPYVENLGYKYNRFGAIALEQDIEHSGLFGEYANFGGDDLIFGNIDGVDFSFGDIWLSKDFDKKFLVLASKKKYIEPFQGLFFVADFHKKIGSDVFILPSITKLQTFASESNAWLRKMDNAKFDKSFAVYAKDPLAAAYVLTPALMEKILFLKMLTKSYIELSFRKNKIYIKIPRLYDSFEPDLNRPIRGDKLASKIQIDLDAMLQIVKILKLNEKIWTS